MPDATRTILQIAELREEAAQLQSKVNQQLSEIERKIVAASQLCNR
jgi:F0F1-type ATP synthase membrane subunit b/b'